MASTFNYLVNIFICVILVNEIHLIPVNCQDEENSQCIPKNVFLALLRLPEVSSNLAAYSRTARIIDDTKNDMVHLKALSTEENDDADICIPRSLYLQLFKDSAMRAHLTSIGRFPKPSEYPFARSFETAEESNSKNPAIEAEKRSLATLAKNDDLPISIRERKERAGEEDEEKRSIPLRYASNDEKMETLLRSLLDENAARNVADILPEYVSPSDEELDMEAFAREYPYEKRNVGSLARDFALPPTAGRRNVASLARDYGLPNGKRNVGALARDRALPYFAATVGGKRNVASLARTLMLPQNGKRQQYFDGDSTFTPENRYDTNFREVAEKRSLAALAKNGDLPEFAKRMHGVPPSGLIFRTLSRHGRSLNERKASEDVKDELLDLQRLSRQNESKKGRDTVRPFDGEESSLERRSKRQIDFSDEYALPVIQNTNVFDYEDLMEALSRQYASAEKRFMGEDAPTVMDEDTSIRLRYADTFQPSKRHIGALARQGWLPSFRTARFSRSPRYLIDRENSTDGPTTDYSSYSPTWSLRPIFRSGPSRARYLQSLHGDCRHGFRRFCSIRGGR